MGSTWTTIGWIVVAVGIIITVISWSMQFGQISQMLSDPAAFQRQQSANPFADLTGGRMVLSIFSLIVSAGSLTWFIVDIVDRRTSWVWIVPYVLCCCCGLQPAVMAIYMLAGRKK
jgi:hypothetical protein